MSANHQQTVSKPGPSRVVTNSRTPTTGPKKGTTMTNSFTATADTNTVTPTAPIPGRFVLAAAGVVAVLTLGIVAFNVIGDSGSGSEYNRLSECAQGYPC